MAIACPSCGKSIPFKGNAPTAVSCPSCEALIDVALGRVIRFASTPVLRTRIGLQIGAKGRIDGKSLEAIGWIRYEDDPDDLDDGEEVTEWMEWHLTDGTTSVWTEETPDGNAFVWHEAPPPAGIDREALEVGSTFETPDGPAKVSEVGIGIAKAMRGELTWTARLGESFSYADAATAGGIVYSLEWEGADEAVEAFRGRAMSGAQVRSAFGITGRPNLAPATSNASASKGKASPAWAFSLGLFFSLLGAVIFGGFGSGTSVFAGTASFCLRSPEPGCPATSTVIGPIPLMDIGRVHRLSLASLTTNLSHAHATEIMLLDADKRPLSAFEGDFWKEEGIEDGEHWTEASTKATSYFRLTKAGTYYLFVGNTTTKGDPDRDRVEIRLDRGVLHPWPWYAHLALVLYVAWAFLSAKGGVNFSSDAD